MLFDRDETVRNCAVSALQTLLRSSPQIRFDNNPDAAVRRASRQNEKRRVENDSLLRKVVADKLNAALIGDNPDARMTAARAINFPPGLPEARQALAECLKSNDKQLREQAVKSLSMIDHPDVFAPLLLALVDEDVAVRSAAANGLQFKTATLREYKGEPLLPPLIDCAGRQRSHGTKVRGPGNRASSRQRQTDRRGAAHQAIARSRRKCGNGGHSIAGRN